MKFSQFSKQLDENIDTAIKQYIQDNMEMDKLVNILKSSKISVPAIRAILTKYRVSDSDIQHIMDEIK